MYKQQSLQMSFGAMLGASLVIAAIFPMAGLLELPLLVLWLVLVVKGFYDFGRRALWMLLGLPIILIYFYLAIALTVFYES